MKLSEAIEAIKDASSPDYFKSIDAAELTDWQDVAFTLYAANAELLEALETLERAHLKGFIDLKNFRKRTGDTIRKHKGE